MEMLFQKIQYTSREQYTAAVDIVLNNLNKIVDNNKKLNDQEKRKFKERFAEHYKKLLNENTTFLSKDETGEETTESRDYLNNKLLPKVSDILIETTRKRKYCPHKCSEILEKRLKLEREKLKLQRYEMKDEGEKLTSQELPTSCYEKLEKKMKAVSSEINQYIQTVESKVDKAKNQKECIALSQKMKICKTDQIIFEESKQEI